VDIRAETRRTGADRSDEHVSRAPRVLADDDRSTPAGKSMGRCPAEGIGEGRLELDIGDAADAVRAEETGHLWP